MTNEAKKERNIETVHTIQCDEVGPRRYVVRLITEARSYYYADSALLTDLDGELDVPTSEQQAVGRAIELMKRDNSRTDYEVPPQYIRSLPEAL